MNYTPRTANPAKDNQFYYGKINPWNKKEINPSCTTYAQGRILENENIRFGTSKKVYKDTWYPVDMYKRCSEVGGRQVSAPVLGCGVVWKSKALPNGHIAIVESVNEMGITFSQWHKDGTFTTSRAYKKDGWCFDDYTLVGFFDLGYGFEDGSTTPTTPTTSTLYYVQSGAYSVLSNAKNQYNKIKKAGFDVICKYDGRLYRLQCGAYSIKKNAEYQARQLNAKGFSTCITTKIPGTVCNIV